MLMLLVFFNLSIFDTFFLRSFEVLFFCYVESILVFDPCFGLFSGHPSQVKTGSVPKPCLVSFFFFVLMFSLFLGLFDKYSLSLFWIVFI
jgi:hypothetical protein